MWMPSWERRRVRVTYCRDDSYAGIGGVATCQYSHTRPKSGMFGVKFGLVGRTKARRPTSAVSAKAAAALMQWPPPGGAARGGGRTGTRAKPVRQWRKSSSNNRASGLVPEGVVKRQSVVQRIDNLERARTVRRDSIAMNAAEYMRAAKKALVKQKVRGRQWYIIDPLSDGVKRWDVTTALALIFTAIATPMEVGFLDAPTSPLDTLFLVNRVVDLVFILDMVLQFFLMCPAPKHGEPPPTNS